MNFRAALFDLDGTLLDTIQDIGDAVNRVLAARGCPTHTTAAYKDFVGEGAHALVERALPAGERTAEAIEETLAAYRRDYQEHWNNATQPYDGILDMLNTLKARGLKLGVLSNKPHQETLSCVRGFFPPGFFDVVLGQRDGVPRKPDPAGAFEAASKMGVSPSEILYIGDTGVDMRTARAAGMFALGVTWGFRPESELRENGAKALAHHPLDVSSMI